RESGWSRRSMRHNRVQMRALIVAGLLVWTAMLGFAQQPRKPAPILTAASEDGFETVVKPFLAENCFPCHGNEKHKKDLNFEALTAAKTLIDDRERWGDVVAKLR